jgi:hypothetical protein
VPLLAAGSDRFLRRMRRTRAAALLVVAAGVMAGCGSEDFPNEPRPAATVELSARIDDGKVVVAPGEVGAGIATITISNQASDEVELNFDGPGKDRQTNEIPAGGVSSIKLALDQGDYVVEPNVSSISSGSLAVGEPRPSAQNELLLP